MRPITELDDYAVTTRTAASAALEAAIEELLGEGLGDGERLAQIGRLGTRLVLQRAVEDEVTAFLGRAQDERTQEARGSRNGRSARTRVRPPAWPRTCRRAPPKRHRLRTHRLHEPGCIVTAGVPATAEPRWRRSYCEHGDATTLRYVHLSGRELAARFRGTSQSITAERERLTLREPSAPPRACQT